MKQTILIFGSISSAIFILFELNKLSLWTFEDYAEAFIVLSGLLFIAIGFLLNRFFYRNGIYRERTITANSNLSKQEHKVLQLMKDGLSNNEIGERLFISENTVKTHVSNVFSKLHARRRTEAIKIGRDLNIV